MEKPKAASDGGGYVCPEKWKKYCDKIESTNCHCH